MFQVLKRFVPACVFVALMPFPAFVFGQSSGPASVAFQIDPAHTGTTQFTPTFHTPLGRLWQVDLGAEVSYPLIADGMVFVTYANPVSYGTNVIALDESTGQVRWGPVPIQGTYFWSNAAYDDGRIYVVNFDGLMQAFNAGDGSLAWSVLLPYQYAFTSPPTAKDGMVYVGGAGEGGTVYALDDSNGALLWTEAVENGDSSSPALFEEGVYVSYSCPQVYSFDALTGATLWYYSGPCEGGGGRTPVARDGKLYVRDEVSTPSGYIFDTATSDLLGRFDAQSVPAIGPELGFFLQEGTLRGIDLASNDVQWSFAGDGHIEAAPIVIDDTVLIGSASGNLYALNAQSGTVTWQTQVGAPILGPDEYNAILRTGLGAGDGIVVVPASNLLTAYRPVPESIFADGFEAAQP
jgi:outer membrane protein assembly factor BamB